MRVLKGPMTKVTIQEVARAAGVSKGTVSRVLNAREGVHEDTRVNVLGVMNQLGFVPDPGARNLARRGKHVIGLSLDGDERRGNPYYGILRDALEARFSSEGYTTQIFSAYNPALLEGVSDGVILLGVHLDDSRPSQLEVRKIPFVMVGHSLEHAEKAPWVDVDNISGLLEAVRHLTKLGHKKIAHLTGAPTGQASRQRLEGYREGLSEHKIKFSPQLIWDGEFTEVGGYRAVRRALASKLEFTAIAAASDEMAFGAIMALEDEGLRVPWDVSVTGFDDLPSSSYVHPALTTVKQDISKVGTRAAEMLLECMAGKKVASALMPVQLIVRASSAASTNIS
jgi:LacI family transcriptional regulator